MRKEVRVKPLTKEQKEKIRTAVLHNMGEDDRHPSTIIGKRYRGNTERYLRDMAIWHGVPIGSTN